MAITLEAFLRKVVLCLLKDTYEMYLTSISGANLEASSQSQRNKGMPLCLIDVELGL